MADAQPLDGVIVADFSRVLAGPLATMTLADLGATVVKVEQAAVGDETRGWGPPWSDANESSYFESINRGKRSLELDLTNADDRELAHRLVLRADVMIENFRGGVLDRFGLDYRRVASENPRLVYCSISGFGSGDGADMPGYDFIVQAVGGLMTITGDPGGEPTKVGVALVDVLTGKDAVIGILAALRERETSGKGQLVEVNLLSSLLGSLVNQASGYLATGVDPKRMGNAHPSIAPYQTLRCADGPLAVAVGNDAQFRRFAQVIGVPALAEHPHFRTNADRVGHREELVYAIERELARHDAETWQGMLLAAGIAAGVVAGVSGGIALAERLGLEPVWDPGGGHVRQVAHPTTYSRTRLRRPQPPPRLGEHNDELRAWLDGRDGTTTGL